VAVETISKTAKQILDDEVSRYEESHPRSKELFARAEKVMPLGVTSSFQVGDPFPIYLESGHGSRVTDVDGKTYVDYHNGFGTMVTGHAHPKISEAIDRVRKTGTHFAATTRTGIEVAEELARRFNAEKWRFVNSGTEATMDAIRLGRAASGKDTILKVEGGYHGHHDAVMYSLVPTFDSSGPADRPSTVPFSRGIPEDTARHTKVVPFNDADALASMLDEYGDEIGVFILEPVMMNAGIIVPQPGYLEKVRELCTKHNVVLVFDEVKTGCTIGPGGATQMFGVQPDLICLAKAVGGGTPFGAFGGKAEIMDEIANGVAAMGTFNGNPLSMAAAKATLTEVLVPQAYEHLAHLGNKQCEGARKVLESAGIPAFVTDLGSKGSITFREEALVSFRDYGDLDDSTFDAYWYWVINRGVYQTPGKEEQWTISVQHSDEDVDLFIDTLASYCEAVTQA
jgi:glutamate-1-semialdehyde 2,1-aminomutase